MADDKDSESSSGCLIIIIVIAVMAIASFSTRWDEMKARIDTLERRVEQIQPKTTEKQ